jgi:hypothetical protein
LNERERGMANCSQVPAGREEVTCLSMLLLPAHCVLSRCCFWLFCPKDMSVGRSALTSLLSTVGDAQSAISV